MIPIEFNDLDEREEASQQQQPRRTLSGGRELKFKFNSEEVQLLGRRSNKTRARFEGPERGKAECAARRL